MPAEARVTKMWRQQKGLIPMLCIGFSLWFLWDGFVGYPRSDERWTKHEELKGKPGEWEKYCAEHGWKTEPPEHYLGPKKYSQQFLMGGVTGGIGLLALTYWLSQRRRSVRTDEETVTTPSGLRLPYSAITHIDKTLWKKKGYAYISYTHNGAEGRFTLDDAKFEAKALDVVLNDITQKSTGARITDPAA
jgi:hypothetical protein